MTDIQEIMKKFDWQAMSQYNLGILDELKQSLSKNKDTEILDYIDENCDRVTLIVENKEGKCFVSKRISGNIRDLINKARELKTK
jgi:hypothetical protein